MAELLTQESTLSQIVAWVKGLFAKKTDVKIYVGTCSTAAATAAKVVMVEAFPTITVNNTTKPVVGTMIAVKFSATNAAENATLNVNSLGGASIYYNESVYTSGGNVAGYKNRYTFYVWDGTYWVWQSWGTDSNTTYSAITDANLKAGTETTARLITAKALKDNFDINGHKVKMRNSSVDVLTASGYFNNNTFYKDSSFTDAYSGEADIIYIDATSGIKYVYDGSIWVNMLNYNNLINKPSIPTKVSDLTNDSGFLTTETDPTVPAWAKASSKPSYTASEVGALPDSTVIPSTLADLSDDATHRLVTDTEKATWNGKGTYSKPSGGIPKTDLANDVRTSLGKADTALQSFTESDPVFVASAAHGITSTDISNWNNKVDVETGKGLSTNDYTTTEKTKLAGIEAGAEVNVQGDWAQNDTTADDYIKNRTHYVESVSTSDVWYQTNVEVGSGTSSPGAYSGTFTLTTGKVYNVTITNGSNSKTYEGIVAEYSNSYNAMLINKNWSNPMQGAETTSDAFYILVQASSVILASVDVYGSGCTVQVSEITENVKKLDRKYLPALNEIDHISSSKSGSVTTVTITETEGATTSFQISDGANGTNGTNGTDGKSAYQVAVDNGFVGTEAQWLASLKGDSGVDLGEVAVTSTLTNDTDKVPSDAAVLNGIEVWSDDINYVLYTNSNLEFNGTNIVDTGINLYNPEIDYVVKFTISNLTWKSAANNSTGGIVGCGNSASPYRGWSIQRGSSASALALWLDGSRRFNTVVDMSSPITILFKKVGNAYTFQINNGTLNTYTSTIDNSAATTLIMGSTNNRSTFTLNNIIVRNIASQDVQLYGDYTKDIKIYPKAKANGIEGLDAAIQKGNKNTVVISSDNVIRGVDSDLTSVDKYKYDELNTVEVLFRGTPVSGLNWYESKNICEIKKDESNYIRWRIESYSCKALIVVGGETLLSQTFTINSGTPKINDYLNYVASIDLYQKVMRILGADTSDNSIVVIYEVDISEYDLSSFNGSEVNINSHIYGYSCDYYCIYVRVNCFDLIGSLLNKKFYSGHYNVFPTYNLTSKLGYNEYITGLGLGGTITETISSTHKKCTATNQSGYFRISPLASVPSTVYTGILAWSVKFRLLSGSITITNGARSTAYVRDTNGNNVSTIEQNVDYILYVQAGQDFDYSLTYGVRASGTFELEAWEPSVFQQQSQIICAETWNGSMFTGAIPYSATPRFTQLTDKAVILSTRVIWYPIGELKLSGTNLQMFNGTTWKQINNS